MHRGAIGPSTRHWVWIGLAVLVAGSALFGLGIAAYVSRVQASATALIKSARVIRTTADAEREIAAWRKSSGKDFGRRATTLAGTTITTHRLGQCKTGHAGPLHH